MWGLRIYVCMYVYMYVCMYVCIYVCMYICMYIYIYIIYIYVCVYGICMYSCLYVCMDAFMYVCMHVLSICLYVCTCFICKYALKQVGTVEARWAHNPEVGRSKLSTQSFYVNLWYTYACNYVIQLKCSTLIVPIVCDFSKQLQISDWFTLFWNRETDKHVWAWNV